MNDDDLERWINLEGPPPDEIRELLDVACGRPHTTRAALDRLDARILAAVAEDRRRWARRRAVKRALGGGLVAACLAAALVLAFRLAAPSDPGRRQWMPPRAATEERAETVLAVPLGTVDEAPATPASGGAGRADAGR